MSEGVRLPFACPFCHKRQTSVLDSRGNTEGTQVRRRRECLVCKQRFTTYERKEDEGRIDAIRLDELVQRLKVAIEIYERRIAR